MVAALMFISVRPFSITNASVRCSSLLVQSYVVFDSVAVVAVASEASIILACACHCFAVDDVWRDDFV